MELKGLKIHREDGTIDTYPFPIPRIIVNSGGSNDDVTEDTETANKLYVYGSGDEDFVNCQYSLGEYKTMQKPPFTVSYVDPNWSGANGTYTDCVWITYRMDEETSPSSVSYFDLGLNTTFADYSKLCIEASYVVGNNYMSGGASCGYYDPNQAGSDGTFVITGYVLDEKLTRERAVHEIDISECGDNVRTVSFLINDQIPLCIYNIWLEK